MMKRKLVAVLAASLLGGAALAQQASESPDPLERRLERIEQSIAKIERKLSASAGGMMEGCRGMMGGGGGSPNDQWGGSSR